MEPQLLGLDLIQMNNVQLGGFAENEDENSSDSREYRFNVYEEENYINNADDQSKEFRAQVRCLVKEDIFESLRKIYAELLVIVAVIAVFTETLHRSVPLFHIHVYFFIYLLGVSILIFLGSFGRTFIHKISGKEIEDCYPGTWHRKKNWLTFCFMFGLIACGIAAVIFTSLGLAAVLISKTCLSASSSAFFFLNFIFTFIQLLFLLMNANRLNDVFGSFHKISILHLAATNISLWLNMVLFSSSKDWQESLHDVHNSSLTWAQKDLNISLHSLESDINSPDPQYHFPKHSVRITSNCWWRVASESEQYEDILSLQLCLQNSTVGAVWKKTADLLYPIMVQHYLIVLYLLYITWKSMSSRIKMQCPPLPFAKSKKCKTYTFFSILVLSIFFCASIVVVILCFTLNIVNFEVIVLYMFIVIFSLSICAVLYGFYRMKVPVLSRSYNPNYVNLYQNFGTYFIYAYGSFNLFAGCISKEKYSLLLVVEALLMIFHAIAQHLFIKSQRLKKSKAITTFLLICNLSLWVLETFTFCSKSITDIQRNVFGAIAWPIIVRIIVPCLAFYRFHCVMVMLDDLIFMHGDSF